MFVENNMRWSADFLHVGRDQRVMENWVILKWNSTYQGQDDADGNLAPQVAGEKALQACLGRTRQQIGTDRLGRSDA